MKAFLVGLLFLMAVCLLSVTGFLLYPLLLLLAFSFRMIISIALLIFGIWLLGKFILYIWEKLNKIL